MLRLRPGLASRIILRADFFTNAKEKSAAELGAAFFGTVGQVEGYGGEVFFLEGYFGCAVDKGLELDAAEDFVFFHQPG